MILTKGTKELLINSTASSFPFRFTSTVAGKEVAATAADATKLAIKGFADFTLASVAVGSQVAAVRARAEKTSIVSIDSAVAAQITTSGSNPAGAAVTILVRQRSTDPLAEYITGDPGRYFRTQAYTFQVPANVTAAQVVTLLHEQITGRAVLFPEADEPQELQVFSTLVDTAGQKKITLTSPDAHVTLEVKINDLDPASTSIVPVFKPSVDQKNDEGRGLYRTLKGTRLLTEGTQGAHNIPGPLELPVVGAQYTAISFETVSTRPELSNHGAADSPVTTGNRFLVYIQETAANEPVIQDLVNFLARTEAGVSKFYADKTSDNVTRAAFLANA